MPRPRRFQASLDDGHGYYHCVSRVVDRNYVFSDEDRSMFRKILWNSARFSGLEVVAWTILSNHFHVLVEVVEVKKKMGAAEIMQRCRSIYSPPGMAVVAEEFERARRGGKETLAAVRAKYQKRMGNLSEFMKTVKQKFTHWFNGRHERRGTLWESRFKSALVEGRWNSLVKVAAYIDLNPVRAGIVKDPVDYEWCSYAEAVAGKRGARRGLVRALETEQGEGVTWRQVNVAYRDVMFGSDRSKAARASLSRKEIAKKLASGKKLTLQQLLRCRVRYFSDGLVIGSEEFVEQFFQSRREAFAKGRQTGARKMRGGEWGELRTARGLALNPISLPDLDR